MGQQEEACRDRRERGEEARVRGVGGWAGAQRFLKSDGALKLEIAIQD